MRVTAWVRRTPTHRRLVASFIAVAATVSATVIGAAPAYAASTADLSVSLTNKVDAVAGKRVTYTVVVTNKGPSKATRVRIDFKTSAKLRSVKYKISHGHCDRGSKEIPCQWHSSVRKGKSVTVTISGVLPKKMTHGTSVTNSVTVDSRTKRINTSNDKATDNYRLGVPRVTAPAAAAPPSISPTGNLAKFTNTAAKVADYSSHALLWTFIVLGAALVWFAIGLTLHRRRRAADADFDANDEDRD